MVNLGEIVADIGILMTDPSPDLLKRGMKTQTRRVMNPQPAFDDIEGKWQWPSAKCKSMVSLSEAAYLGPFGGKHDTLWVRETHSVEALTVYPCPLAWYKADFDKYELAALRNGEHGRGCSWYMTGRPQADCITCAMNGAKFRWRSPRFMARRLARFTLKTIDIRVQRLKHITDEDAIAEGCTFTDYGPTQYRTPKEGWCYGRSTHSDQCMSTPGDGICQCVEPDSWWSELEPEAWTVSLGSQPVGVRHHVQEVGMTKIEWTDETWNPTDGCSVCSPGCANCYAMRFAGRFSKPGERYHGLVTIGKNKRAVWTGTMRLDAGKLAKPLRWKRPRRIFVNSMSDLFHENLSNEEIAAVYGVMAACPQHTFQILTKRARRRMEWFVWISTCTGGRLAPTEKCDEEARMLIAGHLDKLGVSQSATEWPLRNVWEGTSVENQDATDRIDDLRATPAAIRFLSCEPILSNLYLTPHLAGIATRGTISVDGIPREHPQPAIDWVIGGCESGPGARTCDVAWLRSLRDQCDSAGVPFFLKQAVAWDVGKDQVVPGGVGFGPGSERKAGGVIGLPYLDGVQHTAMP